MLFANYLPGEIGIGIGIEEQRVGTDRGGRVEVLGRLHGIPAFQAKCRTYEDRTISFEAYR